MLYEYQNNQLTISILNRNKGKFRFKNRISRQSFGVSFATTQKAFDKNIYLEWQISYDIPTKEGEGKTRLAQKAFMFKGANGKQKYPYELSEFLYFLVKNQLLSSYDIKKLHSEIEGYTQFFLSKPEVQQKGQIKMNGLALDSATTFLPTFYYFNKDNSFSEILIQKQQYASGFQAMLYFCIPILTFSNGHKILGQTSKEKNIKLKYVIDKEKTEIILILFKILAMASRAHQKDSLEILKVLHKNLSV